jgi:hypothetical protein
VKTIANKGRKSQTIADNRKQGKTMATREEHLENADLDLDLDSSLDNSCSEVHILPPSTSSH